MLRKNFILTLQLEIIMVCRKYTVAAVVTEHSRRAGGWSGDPDGTYEASLGEVRVLSDHAGGALQEIRDCRDAIG